MAIPKRVAEQGRKADEMLTQLQEGKIDEFGSPVTPPANTETPPVIPDDPPAAPPEGGTPPAADPAARSGIDWEAEAGLLKAELARVTHSLNVLKGKYSSEITPLNEELRQLRGQLATLQAGAAGAAPGVKPGPVGGLSAEKIEQIRKMYGDDIVDLIMSVSSTAKAEAVAAVKPQLDDIANTNTEEKYAALHGRIAAAHSDWRKIDQLQTWIAFLNETDDATGLPRRKSVMDAYHRFDEGPIIRALGQFKRRTSKGNAALNTQVVPANAGRTDSQNSAAGEDKRTFPRKQVSEFYTHATQRIKNGTLKRDEYDRIDEVYTKAELEGRVLG